MKSCYLLVLFLSVITIAYMQEVKPGADNPMALLEQIFCNNQTQLKEEQCATIISKCPCPKQSITDEAVKTCLNLSKLTECQRVSSFCGSGRECIMKAFEAKDTNKPKPEEVKKSIGDRVACIKKELNIQ